MTENLSSSLVLGNKMTHEYRVGNNYEFRLTAFNMSKKENHDSLIPIGWENLEIPEGCYLLANGIRVVKHQSILSALCPLTSFTVCTPVEMKGKNVSITARVVYAVSGSMNRIRKKPVATQYHTYEDGVFKQIKPWLQYDK